MYNERTWACVAAGLMVLGGCGSSQGQRSDGGGLAPDATVDGATVDGATGSKLTEVVEPYRCLAEPAAAYVPPNGETPAFDPIIEDCPAATDKRPMFALTFDDGPNHPETFKILDYIEKFNITASFMIQCHSIYRTYKAAVVDERDALKKIFDRGHMIASHSYCHQHLSTYPPDLVRKDTRACEDHLAELLGIRPRIYRPPFIDYSPTAMSILQKEFGYKVVAANAYSEDTREYSNLQRSLQNYKNAFDRGLLSYVSLMHDSIDYNFEALPTVIKTFSCAGYEFVTLDTCLGLDSPYRDGKTNLPKRPRHDPQATCEALANVPSLDDLVGGVRTIAGMPPAGGVSACGVIDDFAEPFMTNTLGFPNYPKNTVTNVRLAGGQAVFDSAAHSWITFGLARNTCFDASQYSGVTFRISLPPGARRVQAILKLASEDCRQPEVMQRPVYVMPRSESVYIPWSDFKISDAELKRLSSLALYFETAGTYTLGQLGFTCRPSGT